MKFLGFCFIYLFIYLFICWLAFKLSGGKSRAVFRAYLVFYSLALSRHFVYYGLSTLADRNANHFQPNLWVPGIVQPTAFQWLFLQPHMHRLLLERRPLELFLSLKPLSLTFWPTNSNLNVFKCLALSSQVGMTPGLYVGSPSLCCILETPPGSKLGNCRAHLTCFFFSPCVNSSILPVGQCPKTAVFQFSFYIDAVRPIYPKYKSSWIIV